MGAKPKIKSVNWEIDVNSLSPLQALILLLLDANEGKPVKGKTWLQKEMFLLVHNTGKEEIIQGAQFEPHHYGPYSETIDAELDILRMMGLVEINGPISLKPKGRRLASKLRKIVSNDFLELVEEIKENLNDLSEDELLAYIYFTFPNMTTESRVLERIKRKRERLAVSLYKKGKVSLSKAAQIAGMSVGDFIELLKKRRVPVELGR